MQSKEEITIRSKELKLDTTPISKLLMHYSIPAIISMVVSALYNVVDRIFIGNIPEVGSLAITGVGVTMPIMTIINAFALLIGIGATASVSINLGKKRKQAAEEILGNSISFSLISGGVILIVGLIYMESILNFFGASTDTLIYAKDYIKIILWGTPINILGYSLNNIIRADGRPRYSAVVMGSSCFLNIVLDWLFVMKFNYGISGAAYATIISQALIFICGSIYFTSSSNNIRIKLNTLKLNRIAMFEITAIGIAPFISQFLTSVIQILNNIILKTHGGDYAIGAMATISSVAIMCFMPIQGIAQGAQPVIGYNYGANKKERAIEALKKSTYIALIVMFIALLGIELFPEYIISFFGGDEALKHIAKEGMRIYLLGIPAIAVGMNIILYFQAIGAAKLALMLSLLRQLVFLIPILIIVSNMFGLVGVWWAQSVSDYLSMAVIVYFLKKEINRQRTEEMEYSLAN